MPLGLQESSNIVFASDSTDNFSQPSTTASSDFAPSIPEHRHAGWTGRRSDSSSTSVGQMMMEHNVDVEAEGRPPYLHVC